MKTSFMGLGGGEHETFYGKKKKVRHEGGMHECVKNGDDNSDSSLMSGKALKQVR